MIQIHPHLVSRVKIGKKGENTKGGTIYLHWKVRKNVEFNIFSNFPVYLVRNNWFLSGIGMRSRDRYREQKPV